MDRLTFEGNFCDIAQCNAAVCPCGGPCTQKKVWERLKQYEDTGLEPEQVLELKSSTQGGIHKVDDGWKHVQDLLQAEQAGRLVVLPCEVGDTVYRLQYIEQGTGRYVVGVAEIKFALIWLEEIGRTVFLTREEAEAALEGDKDHA